MTDAIQKALTTATVAMKIASALPNVSDEYDFGPAIAECAAALDAETPATPDDVGELVETLLAYALDEDGDVELSHENVLSAATALERVVRERDQQRELKEHARKCCDQEQSRAESAEAKLAEARKVIDSMVDAFGSMRVPQTTAGAGLQVMTLGPVLERARRFLEETK